MAVGPKTPGAGRKTRAGRPLPSPRRRPGLWWSGRLGFSGLQPSLEELLRAQQGAYTESLAAVPRVALVTLHPEPGWDLPSLGLRWRAERPGGRGWEERRQQPGSGAFEPSWGRGRRL